MLAGTVFLLSTTSSLPSRPSWTFSSSEWALTPFERPPDAFSTTTEPALVDLPPLAPPALLTTLPSPSSTQAPLPEPTPSISWTRPTTNFLNLTSNAWPAPEAPSPDARYLSYLTHSGFHNQRISLTNGLVLAKLLNRTLLVPAVTLGRAVDWSTGTEGNLQEQLELAEHAPIAECRQMTDHDQRRDKCGIYYDARRADWAWFLDDEYLSTQVSLIKRPTQDRAWFQDVLGIAESEIYSFQPRDVARLSYRIHDTLDDAGVPQSLLWGTYTERIHLDDLRRMDDVKLLEFGSLFGTHRLVLALNENKKFCAKIRSAMSYKQETLEVVSEAVANRLGGRRSYVGLHLRVGHGDRFEIEARPRSAGVFRTLLSDAYGLSDALITSLLRSNRRHHKNPTFRPTPLALPSTSTTFRPSPPLVCPHVLYPPDSPLVALNVPLFVATDSKRPRSDANLELFRNTFPCLFFLSDFRTVNEMNQEKVEELEYLERVVDVEGEKLGGFLEPFIDAEVIAKARKVVGTPGSTFSSFVSSVLFESYQGAH